MLFCDGVSIEGNVKIQLSWLPAQGRYYSKCFTGTNSFTRSTPHGSNEYYYPPFTSWQEDWDTEKISSYQSCLLIGQEAEFELSSLIPELAQKVTWARPVMRRRTQEGVELEGPPSLTSVSSLAALLSISPEVPWECAYVCVCLAWTISWAIFLKNH